MAIPEFHRFFRPALEASSDGQPRHWRQIEQAIVGQWNLREEDLLELVPSGTRTRVSDRVQWAITYMSQAKLLDRAGRGITCITDRGLTYLKRAPDPITPQHLMEFPEFVAFETRSKATPRTDGHSSASVTDPVTVSGLTPEETIIHAYQEHNSALAQELLERVKTMPPGFFENLIVQLMLRLGYGGAGDASGRTLGRVGDEGVDGVIKQDKLGLENIYLQAKRWTVGTVGRQDVQAFVGALSGQGATKGVFITTSSFTRDAMEFAKANLNFKLSLIDGITLAQLMIDYDLGVSLTRRYDVKRIDSDFFSEE